MEGNGGYCVVMMSRGFVLFPSPPQFELSTQITLRTEFCYQLEDNKLCGNFPFGSLIGWQADGGSDWFHPYGLIDKERNDREQHVHTSLIRQVVKISMSARLPGFQKCFS